MKDQVQQPEPIPEGRKLINDALDKLKTDKEKEMPKPSNNEEGLSDKLNIETKE